ncbi:MAG: Rrf2 family transcriptional regulator [Coriobacteriia bacterium]|nr:Rrf2 family transcriptional regulator [Coriobacteriia bacterium]
MPITRRTDYAVRMMYELAQLPPGTTLSIKDVSEVADIPESFGFTIAAFLVESSLVAATGFRNHLLSLARPAKEITMDEIIYACEPEFSLSTCVRDPLSCKRSSHCGVHAMWVSLDTIIIEHLRSMTLAEVAQNNSISADLLNSRAIARSVKSATC